MVDRAPDPARYPQGVLPGMSKTEKPVRWAQVLSLIAFTALFVADIGMDILAKEVPEWVYPMLGLLALGVEAPRAVALRHGFAEGRRREWGRSPKVGPTRLCE